MPRNHHGTCSQGACLPTKVLEEGRADPGAVEQVLQDPQMPTCTTQASEPGWDPQEALAELVPKHRGFSMLLLPSERRPLQSRGDDLMGCLSLSTGNVGFVWLSPPPGTEV